MAFKKGKAAKGKGAPGQRSLFGGKGGRGAASAAGGRSSGS